MGYSGEKSARFAYFATLAASLTAFATGSCYSWTSPILPKLQSPDSDLNPLGEPVSTSESAWIVAAMSLGLIFGPALTIFLLKFSTKKYTLLLSIAPIVVAHATCMITYQPKMIILARFFMGVGTGAVWSVLGGFIAEISEDKNRGLLGSIPGVMSNFGSLLVYVLGPVLQIRYFSLVHLVPLILFYILFGFFVPDSPYDLLVGNRHEEAEISLMKLRGSKNIEKELAFMKDTIDSKDEDEVTLSVFFKERGLRKGLMICVLLMAFQQFSGILAVVSYAQTIFSLAGDSISPTLSVILLGIVGTVANIISSFLVDKMGRKILLTSSCIVEALSLFTLGVYFYMLNAGVDVSALSFVPVASLMIFMAFFNIALGIIPWIVAGELFHTSVKAIASTAISLSNFIFSFLVTMGFPYMVEYLGMSWTFWTFAMIMVVGSIFCVLVLPETKGKNFQDIQKLLNK
ncbi:unnamed protein product [Ceutorhynchus assimilis]|uniref:Major facilitator superfamily (MFS) profile domain-containing protein n=1 Tax=Ceutorhynchus assimilis TaxID=467358 RepID=A0A9N9MPY4_9CUCU|nr:unnamed protein product [Ceutorhynchus assimilis]